MDWKSLLNGASAVGTLVAAVSGTVAAATGIAVFRHTRRTAASAAATEDARRWSLELARYASSIDRDGELVAFIRYDRAGPPIRITALEAVAPRGLRLNTFSETLPERRGEAGRRFIERIGDEEGERRRIAMAFDTNSGTIEGTTRQVLVHLPARPFWSRSPTTRVRIAVTYEDRDANRRQRTIVVTSAPERW